MNPGVARHRATPERIAGLLMPSLASGEQHGRKGVTLAAIYSASRSSPAIFDPDSALHLQGVTFRSFQVIYAFPVARYSQMTNRSMLPDFSRVLKKSGDWDGFPICRV